MSDRPQTFYILKRTTGRYSDNAIYGRFACDRMSKSTSAPSDSRHSYLLWQFGSFTRTTFNLNHIHRRPLRRQHRGNRPLAAPAATHPPQQAAEAIPGTPRNIPTTEDRPIPHPDTSQARVEDETPMAQRRGDNGGSDHDGGPTVAVTRRDGCAVWRWSCSKSGGIGNGGGGVRADTNGGLQTTAAERQQHQRQFGQRRRRRRYCIIYYVITKSPTAIEAVLSEESSATSATTSTGSAE
ncbi:hypothetical protein BD410DRAFT_876306 [Rickenella mellea]|uniref:Uncharacterized protein n=1 Tax=Rickenella mellea TaxID=50990 RepID=A0A4Y7PX42_9AGAM|nr:hypothetical protein BD410DRAFT_876306 [Rickenella mellea]